jgi:hypothetical protein
MRLVKELFRAIARGLPILAMVVISSLVAIHLVDVLPPVGIIIVFISVLIIASAAVGFARDVFEGD